MRALVCRSLGDPTLPFSQDSPLFIDVDQPHPQLPSASHVRVRVRAVSLNYATFLSVLGQYQERPPLPFVPGSDFAGIVEEVGADVTSVRIGDAVCGVGDVGSFAEEHVLEANKVFLVPDGCDLVATAGLPVAFGTSHLAITHRARLRPGQVLLVLGAAGGVGLAAVQIGKVCGAIVIAAARGKEKAELLKSVGADLVVDPSDGSLIKSVQSFLKGKKLRGVDVLYDPVGGKLFKDSLKVVNWGAQVLIIGFTSGEIPSIPANIALVKNLTVHGIYWGSYFKNQPSILRDSMNELLLWLSKGLIAVHISHKFPLSQANKAFAAISQRKVLGKVLIMLDEQEESRRSRL
ncbi:hypothetical protein GOP47_0015463 [Adiantum capillus-veneris]|uniref:Enoyl reductase (ER) domain-containing protein n=1 Tax=Adiantum capillus-veneris TaxID=13818 RepID=A0A9D4UKH5_ADICA|nr:hypothetical protein GOP47_0015463 [Adiantum capillus-veneris]